MMIDLTTASTRRLITLGRQFPHAGSAALNRAVRMAKTAISAEIRQGYNIKKTRIDPEMKIIKSTARTLEARIKTSGHRKLPLGYFSPRQVKKKGGGVTVKLKKGGGRELREKTFLITTRYGVGVFKRIGKKRREIKALYGPSVGQLISSKRIKRVVAQFIRDKWPEILRHELIFRMTRANTSGASGTFGSQGEMISR